MRGVLVGEGAHSFCDKEAVVTPAIEQAFRHAVSEAYCFVGQTAPNPAVGCALLDHQGRLLVVAAHHRAGEFHAERLAVERARALGLVEKIHTVVVTLEPCNHTGRTPPCTEILLTTPMQVLWIGCQDPNPFVKGKGAARLEAAGCAVYWLEQSRNGDEVLSLCQALIAPFVWRMLHRRPWITVKQALNRRGDMRPPAGQKTFTSRESLCFAHRLRRVTDGIITATGTVRTDKPDLTVRYVSDHVARKRTLVVCGQEKNIPAEWLCIMRERFVVSLCTDCHSLPQLLSQMSTLWMLVEAGPTLLKVLHDVGLWDDWLTISHRQSEENCEENKSAYHQPDQWYVTRQHDITPISLLPEWAQCQQEQACFPVL
ncbi:MAG: bifunctional diaminohydroxyphosphoribosylaminopyrimidine deaminase/5-amino-6-(5-phosphoribosylamino)uracil reductase RibD [Acetobacter sp.]|nr:bifunctional diaminohydroxyphosphoribosylaminopyrimidine deaminase/5-amino-6-(5-phosphoribosylamino)uracil reductase RibD [Acetobacter sp.]